MNLLHSLFIVPLIFMATATMAQDDGWDVYLAQYDTRPGSTALNMSIVKRAPIKTLPYLVKTGVTFSNCDNEGLPIKDEFDHLYAISDSVVELVAGMTETEMVGSFTYDCYRLDYLYVHDTTHLRDKLTALYTRAFKSYRFHIDIEPDAQWEAYLQFLYPNEETQEFMSNEKVLIKLMEAGDKLERPRPVDHWLYFATDKDRKLFIQFAKSEQFKVEGTAKIETSDALPYQLHISRVDSVDAASIGAVTLKLRRKARSLNGDYDGWETVVVTD